MLFGEEGGGEGDFSGPSLVNELSVPVAKGDRRGCLGGTLPSIGGVGEWWIWCFSNLTRSTTRVSHGGRGWLKGIWGVPKDLRFACPHEQ